MTDEPDGTYFERTLPFVIGLVVFVLMREDVIFLAVLTSSILIVLVSFIDPLSSQESLEFET
jgi:hypothetical protein